MCALVFRYFSICPVVSDVPQGSVLGPILFIIYINDLTQLWSSGTVSVKLFANDTKIYTVLQNDSAFSTDLKSCLDAILEWSALWQ
jgi:ribonucleases P/MRP protein subunit RPP40